MICKKADDCSKYKANYGNPYPHQSPCEHCKDYEEPGLRRDETLEEYHRRTKLCGKECKRIKMSNRFLNNRKLTYKEFFSYDSLIDFVNDNEIESDDIQQIAQAEYHKILLIYWE